MLYKQVRANYFVFIPWFGQLIGVDNLPKIVHCGTGEDSLCVR